MGNNNPNNSQSTQSQSNQTAVSFDGETAVSFGDDVDVNGYENGAVEETAVPSSPHTQPQNQPINKYIRALWYAKVVPELNRHAILNHADNPLIIAAYQAILGGQESIDRLLIENRAAADLLAMAADYAPHAGQLDQIRKLRQESGLPTEFFERVTQKPVMVLPEIEPGQGEWPNKPHHTCKTDNAAGDASGLAIYWHNGKVSASSMNAPSWRGDEDHPACRGCQYDRAKRISLQVLWELTKRPLWALEMNQGEYRLFTQNTRQNRKRKGIAGAYTALPLEDDNYFVIHDQESIGGERVINDKTAVYNLLRHAAVSTPVIPQAEGETPKYKRVSSSGGFGGNYQGTRGDGRIKQARRNGEEVGEAFRVWTPEAKAALAALDIDTKRNQKTYSKKITARDMCLKLAANGISLRSKAADLEGLYKFISQFDDIDLVIDKGKITLISEDVTDNAHVKNPKSTCDLCVTNVQDDECIETAEVPEPALYEPKPLHLEWLQ